MDCRSGRAPRSATLSRVLPARRSPWRTGGPFGAPAPVLERLRADVPLFTGQRSIDLLFPLARGSSTAVPGGFGTGKTVSWSRSSPSSCDADVVVYVGCGERGNEMADVLAEFHGCDDPRTGRSLLDRTDRSS